jgi:hypothetical protein
MALFLYAPQEQAETFRRVHRSTLLEYIDDPDLLQRGRLNSLIISSTDVISWS